MGHPQPRLNWRAYIRAIHDWQGRELAEQIATGAAIYSLLRQGYKLAEVIDALGLSGCREGQRLVAIYLLHSGKPYMAQKQNLAMRSAR